MEKLGPPPKRTTLQFLTGFDTFSLAFTNNNKRKTPNFLGFANISNGIWNTQSTTALNPGVNLTSPSQINLTSPSYTSLAHPPPSRTSIVHPSPLQLNSTRPVSLLPPSPAASQTSFGPSSPSSFNTVFSAATTLTSHSSTSSDPGSPDLILLFASSSFSPTDIAVYKKSYNKFFPTSPLLVIPSSLTCFLSTKAQNQRRLATVIKTIGSFPPGARILIHAFSASGSYLVTELAESYKAKTGNKLPQHALILDSAPGHLHYNGLVTSLSTRITTIIIFRFPLLILLHLFVAFCWFVYSVIYGASNNRVMKIRERFEDYNYWNPETTPRCYLFSINDNVVNWRDVEDHGMEAMDNGVPVMLVKFKESVHCMHILESSTEYWDSVVETWDLVSKQSSIGRAM